MAAVAVGGDAIPGSDGEHRLQEKYGKTTHALAFYRHQVINHLNPTMREFLTRQEMMFVATQVSGGAASLARPCAPSGVVLQYTRRTSSTNRILIASLEQRLPNSSTTRTRTLSTSFGLANGGNTNQCAMPSVIWPGGIGF